MVDNGIFYPMRVLVLAMMSVGLSLFYHMLPIDSWVYYE